MASFAFLFLTLGILLLAACSPAPEAIPSPSPSAPPTSAPTATPIPPSWDGLADPALWQGGSDYLLTVEDGALRVQANKISPNAYMEAAFPPLDLRAAPYASLTALSDRSANITVGLVDADGKEAWLIGNYANREMAHATHPLTHSFVITYPRRYGLKVLWTGWQPVGFSQLFSFRRGISSPPRLSLGSKALFSAHAPER